MPHPTIVSCRGWREVADLVVETLGEQAARDPLALHATLVLVPTAAACHLTRRRLERELLKRRSAILLPVVTTPEDLVRDLAARTLGRVRLVDPLLREVLMEKAFASAEDSGAAPPFAVHGGLARRVLQFYDDLHFNADGEQVPLARFEARALEELDAPDDEGAVKMTAQTRFLYASFEAYRGMLRSLGLSDAPEARSVLRDEPFPYEQVLVLGSETLRPLDRDFLSKAVGQSRLTVVVEEPKSDDEARARPPRLLVPGEMESLSFVSRDREEVLLDVVRLVKLLHDEGRLPPPERIAVVVPHPLPYLYLAKKIFREAGLPFQLQDSFPLATEPYVAAVDLVLELLETDAHRSQALSLLRSPFFRFPGVGPEQVAAFDELTLRYRESGGSRRWRALRERWSLPPVQPSLPGMESRESERRALPALEALVDATDSLSSIASEGPLVEKIRCLREFLDRYGRPLAEVVPEAEAPRHRRSRAALQSILDRLASAARLVGDPPAPFSVFREKLRRAVEAHTFALRTGERGIEIVDARSAGFGSFDLVVLVGLNEGEWPSRSERSIFYPQWLLREFGWPSDRELLARERARFQTLLALAGKRLALFRHQLEAEVATVPSPFLEDVSSWVETTGEDPERLASPLGDLVVTRSEALRRGLLAPEQPVVRERRSGVLETTFTVPEPVSPTAFELYLKCPFKYFSRYLLGLEEEEDIDDALTPLERGRLLHDVLQEGFSSWDRGPDAPCPIDPENYDEALGLFRSIAMGRIPPEHRSVELERLFGGSGQPGAIEWLLRREMVRGTLARRLVEHTFQSPLKLDRGPFGESPWYVRVKGRVDRADVDEGGYLHIFDYKSGRAPDAATALQVPLYAMCLSQELDLPVREASYLSFRDRKAATRADFARASALLTACYGEIAAGRFPPRPHKETLCFSCGFVGVCRKEIQEQEPLLPGTVS